MRLKSMYVIILVISCGIVALVAQLIRNSGSGTPIRIRTGTPAPALINSRGDAPTPATASHPGSHRSPTNPDSSLSAVPPLIPTNMDATLVDELMVPRDADAREIAFRKIVQHGNACLPALHQALWTTTELAILEQLCRTLAGIGTDESIRIFVDFLDDPQNRHLREKLAPTLMALEQSGPAHKFLEWLAVETNEIVTAATIDCLQRVGDTNLLLAAWTIYAEPFATVRARENIRQILEKIRDTNTVDILAGLLQQKDDSAIQASAALGLANLGTPAAIDVLMTAIENFPELPADHHLIVALGSMENKESFDYLSLLMQVTADRRVKNAIATALARAVTFTPKDDYGPEESAAGNTTVQPVKIVPQDDD